MNRRRTAWCGLIVVLPLAGCAGPAGTGEGTADPSPSATPADPATVAERAGSYGVVPEYVLTIDVEGLTAISHAGGAYGADGYSAVLADASTGAAVMVSAVAGGITAGSCADLPVLTTSGSTADGPVECRTDGEMFHRTAGDAQEYAVERDGALVRVSGSGVEAEVLRAALESVRVPTADELDTLLPPLSGPVERGDLPPGDGAPDNSVGRGG